MSFFYIDDVILYDTYTDVFWLWLFWSWGVIRASSSGVIFEKKTKDVNDKFPSGTLQTSFSFTVFYQFSVCFASRNDTSSILKIKLKRKYLKIYLNGALYLYFRSRSPLCEQVMILILVRCAIGIVLEPLRERYLNKMISI